MTPLTLFTAVYADIIGISITTVSSPLEMVMTTFVV
jgi:hypothetical protein